MSASLTSQQLEELEQLRRTVTSLHEELDVLRSLNTDLENEIEAVVRIQRMIYVLLMISLEPERYKREILLCLSSLIICVSINQRCLPSTDF